MHASIAPRPQSRQHDAPSPQPLAPSRGTTRPSRLAKFHYLVARDRPLVDHIFDQCLADDCRRTLNRATSPRFMYVNSPLWESVLQRLPPRVTKTSLYRRLGAKSEITKQVPFAVVPVLASHTVGSSLPMFYRFVTYLMKYLKKERLEMCM